MYSVPGRSVHRFLHARLHVWQPMHLSRWNTMETWARTFMSSPLSLPLRAALQLADEHVSVADAGWRAVIVETVGVLRVCACAQDQIQPHPHQGVRATALLLIPDGRLRPSYWT